MSNMKLILFKFSHHIQFLEPFYIANLPSLYLNNCIEEYSTTNVNGGLLENGNLLPMTSTMAIMFVRLWKLVYLVECQSSLSRYKSRGA